MRLLLDTQVVIWWLVDDDTLSGEIKNAIDSEPEVYVSSVTVWVVAARQASGKLDCPDDVSELIVNCAFRELPVSHRHAVTAARLPAIHGDPFDRMLVAQARCEELTLVTRDADIHRYEIPILKA
jgi:PIN domain nuclease of toxin-antitoxin system